MRGEPLPHVRHSGRVTLNIIRALRDAENPNPGHPHLSGAPVGGGDAVPAGSGGGVAPPPHGGAEAALEEARARRARLEQYRAAEDGRVSSSAGRRRGPTCSWRRTSSWKKRSTSC